MHPTLIDTDLISIKTYGLFLAMAFMVGIFITRKRSLQQGIDPQIIMDLSVWVIIASIAGARFYYVVTHWNEYSGNLLSIINPFYGGKLIGIAGMSMQGGFIFAIITGIIFLKRKNLPVWKIADICAFAMLIGLSIGRIGCFFNGCCYGGVCDLPWGMVFAEESAAGWQFPGIYIHPTQLYSSLANLILLFLVQYLERFKKFDGFTFWITIGLYCMWRFSIDFVRYYDSSQVVFRIGQTGFVNHQIVSIIGLGISFLFFYYLQSKRTIHQQA